MFNLRQNFLGLSFDSKRVTDHGLAVNFNYNFLTLFDSLLSLCYKFVWQGGVQRRPNYKKNIATFEMFLNYLHSKYIFIVLSIANPLRVIYSKILSPIIRFIEKQNIWTHQTVAILTNRQFLFDFLETRSFEKALYLRVLELAVLDTPHSLGVPMHFQDCIVGVIFRQIF